MAIIARFRIPRDFCYVAGDCFYDSMAYLTRIPARTLRSLAMDEFEAHQQQHTEISERACITLHHLYHQTAAVYIRQQRRSRVCATETAMGFLAIALRCDIRLWDKYTHAHVFTHDGIGRAPLNADNIDITHTQGNTYHLAYTDHIHFEPALDLQIVQAPALVADQQHAPVMLIEQQQPRQLLPKTQKQPAMLNPCEQPVQNEQQQPAQQPLEIAVAPMEMQNASLASGDAQVRIYMDEVFSHFDPKEIARLVLQWAAMPQQTTSVSHISVSLEQQHAIDAQWRQHHGAYANQDTRIKLCMQGLADMHLRQFHFTPERVINVVQELHANDLLASCVRSRTFTNLEQHARDFTKLQQYVAAWD